jgi:hypothetical protein
MNLVVGEGDSRQAYQIEQLYHHVWFALSRKPLVCPPYFTA